MGRSPKTDCLFYCYSYWQLVGTFAGFSQTIKATERNTGIKDENENTLKIRVNAICK